MKSIKEIRNEINESKQEDIADLKALLKNPDPKIAKNYGGIEGYKKMIQSKIDRLMKEETELEEEAFKGESFLNKAEQYWGWFKVNKEKDYLSSASAFLNDFFNLYKNKGMMPKHAFKKATDLKGKISKELKKLGISESTEELDEALTRAQRIKRSQIAKRNKAKIQRALKRGKNKKASTETLQKRAKKKARDLLYTKLLKGRNRADVSAGEQERIEKKLDKMQGGINRIAKKLLPQLKKAEQEKGKKKSEE
jgi:monoamine oxidase